MERKKQISERWLQNAKEGLVHSSECDEEEEAILRKVRKEKMRKRKMERGRRQFGSVVELSGSSFIQEVINAGQDIWVYVLLYEDEREDCL